MADNDLTKKALDQWTADDITTAAKSGLPTTYDKARLMLEEHDYFQDGKLWPGERAEGGLTTEQMRRIKDVFIADPLLEEVRENRSNGLLQREPTVGFDLRGPQAVVNEDDLTEEQKTAKQQTDAERDQRVEETVKAIAAWWDRTKFWERVKEAFGRTSYSRRSALRVFVPTSRLLDATLLDPKTQVGVPVKAFNPASTLAEALSRIEVEAPLPDNAGRFKLVTQEDVAVVVTGSTDQDRVTELWSIENGDTVVRLPGIPGNFGDRMAGRRTITYPLGGRLPICEMKTAELVTEPIIRQQSLLNLQTTVLGCATSKAGFPERYISNAEPPGLWRTTPPDDVPANLVETSTDLSGRTIYKHQRPWVFGFTQVAEVLGEKITETTATGTIQRRETPTVTRFEPVDPTYVKIAIEVTKNRLYHLCRQGHLANDSTAEASGVAYQQARAGHEADLVSQKGALEGMVRDVLEVVLAYAGLMHPATKQFLEEFRAVVTLHVTSGPITPAESQEVRANLAARLISQETAMGRIGVEDITAEMAAILRNPAAAADMWTKISAAIGTLVATVPGLAPDGAAALLKLSDEEIEIFRTGVAPVRAGGSPSTPKLAVA